MVALSNFITRKASSINICIIFPLNAAEDVVSFDYMIEIGWLFLFKEEKWKVKFNTFNDSWITIFLMQSNPPPMFVPERRTSGWITNKLFFSSIIKCLSEISFPTKWIMSPTLRSEFAHESRSSKIRKSGPLFSGTTVHLAICLVVKFF